ncbi:hypothetical protein FOA52_007348 [Chlamydomonas sp. UWO 241]|nr:hypothetical protein FOA52_007348 [Chlamydomonas sp. UWO 241]
MELQARLHEQLEAQRQLQLSLEAHGQYIAMLMQQQQQQGNVCVGNLEDALRFQEELQKKLHEQMEAQQQLILTASSNANKGTNINMSDAKDNAKSMMEDAKAAADKAATDMKQGATHAGDATKDAACDAKDAAGDAATEGKSIMQKAGDAIKGAMGLGEKEPAPTES